MCGIIGFVGKKSASPILLEGLRRLEYRGYDSAGIAILQDADLVVRKKRGKIDSGLATVLQTDPVAGNLGIGHTRWATHGIPSDRNCHPHFDQSEKIAVVHNGVIENYDSLKDKLLAAGHKFKSDTDTEVLAHLIGDFYEKQRKKNLTQAVCDALRDVIGTYGIAVICADEPDKIVGARRGSPLIIGIGKGENFLASDANAIVAHTKKVIYLNDYDVATITPKKFKVINLGADTANVQISKLEFSQEDAVRGEHAHFMLKEIYEQPRTVENALRGRVDHKNATAHLGGLNLSEKELRSLNRIVIAASGTSWHAALVGEYLIEELAQIPVEVEFAHEFCYRNAPLVKNTMLLVLSQSGETADT
ncbi:MAG TPA: glutamine--fructose-6-phosphate transaminase (isomerizing), partial [Dongiaceae bacterium]|nr:glutamine--fructose-6-phosphate transaminase (isomerizing) [Dongiaceae bacterium]